MPTIPRRTFFQAGGAAALVAGLSPGAAAAAVPARQPLPVEDGYDLWLRYRLVDHPGRRREYTAALPAVVRQGGGLIESAAQELKRGLAGLLGVDVPEGNEPTGNGGVLLGTPESSPLVREHVADVRGLGPEGYVLRRQRIGDEVFVVVAGEGERGVLYGAFHLLRLLQTQQSLRELSIREKPAGPFRVVNHWDNLDRTVERGYAGLSIFQWDDLPELDPRYEDYARALASIGVNGAVVNNVNANADFLSTERLPGLAALAGVLRRWGVTFYLSANYASPMALTAGQPGAITTADPFDAGVRRWWRDKVAEIYELIPDFGGFLVKANSEGQPGPLNYGRTHADGANMLAELLAPHGGIVMWRSFVHEGFSDWASYQYRTFTPLDGDFADNVAVQTKNGPIDFQVREPVNPLFGAMPNTNQMVELQITQEYTGHSTHLCYLVPEWKQVLGFDTGGQGRGPTVAQIVDGSAYDQRVVGFAGVINFGDDRDWTGYQLGAANTHGYGRLAWNPDLPAEDVAEEWVRMTFGNAPRLVRQLTDVLLRSWETYEDYTSPLGMGYLTYPLGAHFDPDPRSTLNLSHFTDANGTGFDRTMATGTGYTGLYSDYWSRIYESLDTMPDELLLFMHKVPYDHVLHSGKTVIQHIYDTHFDGLMTVEEFRRTWDGLAGYVDSRRHADVAATFDDHYAHATTWRDVMVAFFFSFSRILDEHRQWLQVALPGSENLLMGGWPNRVGIDIGNATPDEQTVHAGLVAPNDDWFTTTGQATIASTEFGRVTAPVQPPLTADILRLDLQVLPSRIQKLGATAQDVVVAPVGRRCHLALDAGSSRSPLVPGYARLTPGMSWDADRGYGWVGSTPQERDRGSGFDALRRDFVGNYPAHTLRIAVPAGRHVAYALVGDGGPDSAPTYISIGGSRVAETPAMRGGQFTWVSFGVDGGPDGREVDLTFDSDPDKFWHLCALAIPDPESVLPPVVVTDATADPVWFTGGATPVAVSVTSTARDRSIAVTATVAGPDGWTAEPVTQTLAPGEERVLSVPVTPSNVPQNAELTVTVTADVEVGDGQRTLGVVAVPRGTDVPLALDAGAVGSPVLDSWAALTPATAWNEQAGFGWVGTAPDDRDRNRLDVLRRDFVLGRDAEYVLRVAVPAGPHRAYVLTGDAYAQSGTTTILENGTVLGASPDEIIPQGEFRWFSFEIDGGETGRTADLEIRGALRDRYWRVVALVLQSEA